MNRRNQTISLSFTAFYSAYMKMFRVKSVDGSLPIDPKRTFKTEMFQEHGMPKPQKEKNKPKAKMKAMEMTRKRGGRGEAAWTHRPPDQVIFEKMKDAQKTEKSWSKHLEPTSREQRASLTPRPAHRALEHPQCQLDKVSGWQSGR